MRHSGVSPVKTHLFVVERGGFYLVSSVVFAFYVPRLAHPPLHARPGCRSACSLRHVPSPPAMCHPPMDAPHSAPTLAGPHAHKGLSAERIAALPAQQLNEAGLAALQSHTCDV